MKNAHNTSSALRLVPTSKPAKTPTPSTEPSVVGSAAKYTKVNKKTFLAVRQDLRKKATVLRSAAHLLRIMGLIGEAAFLAAGLVMREFMLTALNVSQFVATFSGICVGVSGLVFGIVCVVFATCLYGVADTIQSDIKKLTIAK